MVSFEQLNILNRDPEKNEEERAEEKTEGDPGEAKEGAVPSAEIVEETGGKGGDMYESLVADEAEKDGEKNPEPGKEGKTESGEQSEEGIVVPAPSREDVEKEDEAKLEDVRRELFDGAPQEGSAEEEKPKEQVSSKGQPRRKLGDRLASWIGIGSVAAATTFGSMDVEAQQKPEKNPSGFSRVVGWMQKVSKEMDEEKQKNWNRLGEHEHDSRYPLTAGPDGKLIRRGAERVDPRTTKGLFRLGGGVSKQENKAAERLNPFNQPTSSGAHREIHKVTTPDGRVFENIVEVSPDKKVVRVIQSKQVR